MINAIAEKQFIVTLVVLALALAVATGNDVKQGLRMRPLPMPKLNPALRMGQWFIHYYFAPCSWQSASKLTDRTVNYQPAGKGVLQNQLTSNGQCTSVEERMFPTKQPGVYKHMDNIGSVMSGEYQVVVTDYNCFSIGWGCTKFSALDNTCDDPWLFVLTRMPKVNPKCLQKANRVLADIFQLRLGDLQRVPHGKGCLPTPPPPKKGMF